MSSVMAPPRVKAPADYIEQVMISVKTKNPAEPEFHQAVREVFDSLRLVLAKHPEYQSACILERIVEPERVIMFRVPWFDDQRKYPGKPRVPHRDEQRDRTLQGRTAFPCLGESGHSEVLSIRAGVQELAHHAAHGRRQGRLGFRSQRKERQRSDALLPELHDRTTAAHRTGHRRSGRGHRRGWAGDRLSLWPVQTAAQ